MHPTDQTHVLVASLYAKGNEESRYGYKKTVVFQALKDLAIERLIGSDGVATYITFDQLAVLDEYFNIRKDKGKKASEAFAQKHAEQSTDNSAKLSVPALAEYSTEYSTALFKVQTEAIALLQTLSTQATHRPIDALAPQRQLKEAAEEGWVLSSRQVREIIGVKSWSGGDRFGYSFERAGKIGGQTGWMVKKK